jgi:hypothetical protein
MFLSKTSFLFFLLDCGNAIGNGATQQDPLACDMVSSFFHSRLMSAPFHDCLSGLGVVRVPSAWPCSPSFPGYMRVDNIKKSHTSLTMIRFAMATPRKYVAATIDSTSTQNDKRQMGGQPSAATPIPLPDAHWIIDSFLPAI